MYLQFFFFSFSLYVAGLFLFLLFFLLFFQHVALSFSFLFFFFFFFCSFRVGLFLFFLFLLLVCSCFFFLLLSIPAFFFVLFVDVVLWCLRLSFTVTRFVLSPWRTLLAQAPNRTMLYTHLQHPNDTIIKTQWQRQTQEDFFNKYVYFLLYCKSSKGLFKVFVWEGVGDRT